MGSTSTTHRELAVVQAEYDALPNKRSRDGVRLRAEMKAAKEAQTDALPKIVPAEPMPKSKTAEEREVLAPDLTAGGLLTEKSAVYWCGIRTHVEGDPDRPHPPFHNTALAGVTFASWYRPWEGDRPEDEGSQRGNYPGMMVTITVSQMATLKERLKKTLVRWRAREGRHAHGHQVTMVGDADVEEAISLHALDKKQSLAYRQKHGGFRVLDGDEPLSKYLYCVKADGATEGTSWRPSAQIPAPILETGIESP